MYWNTEHQQAIEAYYWCYTASTSADTRHLLFNTVLYTPLLTTASKALQHYRNKIDTEDNQQELLTFMYTHLLPRMQGEQLQGVLNYLYLSSRRWIVTNIFIKSTKQPVIDNNYDVDSYDSSNYSSTCTNDALTTIHKQETILHIQAAINAKIEQQKVVNKSNTIYLLLLKQYLIDNDYDAIGFKPYVMQAMQINLSTYRVISSRVGISTMIFKEEKNYKRYKKKNKRIYSN